MSARIVKVFSKRSLAERHDRQGRIISIEDRKAWYWLAIRPDGSFASGKADTEKAAQNEALGFLDTADTSIIVNYVRTW